MTWEEIDRELEYLRQANELAADNIRFMRDTIAEAHAKIKEHLDTVKIVREMPAVLDLNTGERHG